MSDRLSISEPKTRALELSGGTLGIAAFGTGAIGQQCTPGVWPGHVGDYTDAIDGGVVGRLEPAPSGFEPVLKYRDGLVNALAIHPVGGGA